MRRPRRERVRDVPEMATVVLEILDDTEDL